MELICAYQIRVTQRSTNGFDQYIVISAERYGYTIYFDFVRLLCTQRPREMPDRLEGRKGYNIPRYTAPLAS